MQFVYFVLIIYHYVYISFYLCYIFLSKLVRKPTGQPVLFYNSGVLVLHVVSVRKVAIV